MIIERTKKLSPIGILILAFGTVGADTMRAQSSTVAEAALAGPSREKPKKSKEAPATPTEVSETEQNVYRIGVEDELQISVWHEPDLSTIAVVRPDGKITMPLLNDLSVVGLRPDELQTLLAGNLKPFVNEPHVTVIARNIRSRKVSLVGHVLHQGSFSLNGRLTVLELIADAGGLSPFAKGSSIYVLRANNGQKTRIPFNYKKSLSGKEQNITLIPGDVVVVP